MSQHSESAIKGPCVIHTGTDAEQARGLAENLGHRFCDELGGFVLSSQELAELLNANLPYIARRLDTTVITATVNGAKKPVAITVYSSPNDLKLLDALHQGHAKTLDLLQWILKQDRLYIKRWMHPGRRESVEVRTALDDEDNPSGKADTALAALLQAKKAQEAL